MKEGKKGEGGAVILHFSSAIAVWEQKERTEGSNHRVFHVNILPRVLELLKRREHTLEIQVRNVMVCAVRERGDAHAGSRVHDVLLGGVFRLGHDALGLRGGEAEGAAAAWW